MREYYIDLNDELAEKLKKINDDEIIETLESLAADYASSDDLSAYDSVSEIMEDDCLSPAKKKQLKLKAERRSSISKR
jgi:hypothetical protein